MSKSTQMVVAAVLVVATVLLGAAAQLARRPPAERLPPDPGSFRVLIDPQDEADRLVIDSYRGKSIADLSTARVLGTDRWGRHYLLVEHGRQLCLIVLSNAESSGGGCGPAAEARREGTWLKGGARELGATSPPDFLAIVLPDEYDVATFETALEVTVREPNLVVYETRVDHADEVVIRSDRYRDITIRTMAK